MFLFLALILKPLIAIFSKKKVGIVILKPNKDLVYMNELYQSGTVKPIIDGHYSLEEVPKAFSLFGKAAHKGKIVILVGDGRS